MKRPNATARRRFRHVDAPKPRTILAPIQANLAYRTERPGLLSPRRRITEGNRRRHAMGDIIERGVRSATEGLIRM